MSASAQFEAAYKKILVDEEKSKLADVVTKLNDEITKQSNINRKSGTKAEDKVDLDKFKFDIKIWTSLDQEQTLEEAKKDRAAKYVKSSGSGSFGSAKVKIDTKRLELEAMNIDQFEWDELREDIDYEGFNRAELLRQVTALGLTQNQITKIVATIAFRGPKKAATIRLKELVDRTYVQVGIKSGSAGKSDPKVLTANRMISLFPVEAAIGLKKMRCPGRDRETPLPPWLQFPTAASLPMCQQLSELHESFSRHFSETIKGKFQEDIYNSIATNKVNVEPGTMIFLKLNDNVMTEEEEKAYWSVAKK